MVKIFNRPSREQLRKINEEINTLNEIKEIMTERAQLLNKEISELDRIIDENREKIMRLRVNLMERIDDCLDFYGILELKRLSLTSEETLMIEIKKESILGIEYEIPVLRRIREKSYSVNRSNELLDKAVEYNMELLQALINYSKYYEARKILNEELFSIRRRLNSIKNILLNDKTEERKKIINYLSEKERFERVMEHKKISLAREKELFK